MRFAVLGVCVAVLLVSAFGKIVMPIDGAYLSISAQRSFGVLEVAVASSMVSSRGRSLGVWLCLSMMVGGYAMSFLGYQEDCGCFGNLLSVSVSPRRILSLFVAFWCILYLLLARTPARGCGSVIRPSDGD
jgi:hypothetical protein